jgi:putative transposase
MQNGFCESFNGRMRDELLNESLFLGLEAVSRQISIGNFRLRITPSAAAIDEQKQ